MVKNMSKKNRNRNKARKEVIERGGHILKHPHFRACMKQKHHNNTIGSHSIGVAEDSLIIADALEKIGLYADRDALVRSSLCHDWGMVGRYDKYRSQFQTCINHPGDSLKITEKEYPDLSFVERDSILHHMFPVLPAPPRTLEGMIVCVADKKSSIREEVIQRYKVMLEKRRGGAAQDKDGKGQR